MYIFSPHSVQICWARSFIFVFNGTLLIFLPLILPKFLLRAVKTSGVCSTVWHEIVWFNLLPKQVIHNYIFGNPTLTKSIRKLFCTMSKTEMSVKMDPLYSKGTMWWYAFVLWCWMVCLQSMRHCPQNFYNLLCDDMLWFLCIWFAQQKQFLFWLNIYKCLH